MKDRDSQLIYEAYSQQEVLEEGVKEWLLGLGACILGGGTGCMSPEVEMPPNTLGSGPPTTSQDGYMDPWSVHRDKMGNRPVLNKNTKQLEVKNWFTRWFRSIEEVETGTLDDTRLKTDVKRPAGYSASELLLMPADRHQTMMAGMVDQLLILKGQEEKMHDSDYMAARSKEINKHFMGHLYWAFKEAPRGNRVIEGQGALFNMFHTIKNTEYGKIMKDHQIMEVLLHWGADPARGWPGWNKYTEEWFNRALPWYDKNLT